VEIPPSKSLGLNHYKDGDVGVGVFPEGEEPLLRQADAAHEVLKAWVGAEVVNPQVSFEEVRYIRGALLICLLKKFERPVLVT
jgi:hypothetical protein